MKKISLHILALIFMTACGAKTGNSVPNETSLSVVSSEREISSHSSKEESQQQEMANTPPSGISGQSYDDGYKFGHDMGYIAGKDGLEYNGSLPVGPNTCSYSYNYRCGYAAGYSAGFDKGNRLSHSGSYANDTESFDDAADEMTDEVVEEEADEYYCDDF